MRFFSDLVPRHILAVSILTLMAACGGGGSGSSPAPPGQNDGTAPPPPVTPDFSEVDAAFQSFIDESLVFDGISYVVVDAGGTLHTGTFGDHTEDTVVMLASTSKVPAVMTLMALEEDPASTFSMSLSTFARSAAFSFPSFSCPNLIFASTALCVADISWMYLSFPPPSSLAEASWPPASRRELSSSTSRAFRERSSERSFSASLPKTLAVFMRRP